MKVWFMYDCHLFARVGDGTSSREAMKEKARELFAEDGCGSLFAHDTRGHSITHVNGRPQATGKYGIDEVSLDAFFDCVEDHANWEARG